MILETLSRCHGYPSILPRLQTASAPQTSGVGNHSTSAKIQTTPLGQGASKGEGEAAGRTQIGSGTEKNQRVQIVHAKTAEDVGKRTCQRSELVYGRKSSEGSK